MTETSEAAPEEARDELETAISEALTKAYCMAVTYAAVNLVSEGVPLGYPEAGPETAKLLTAVDTYAGDEVAAALEIARRVPLTTVFGHRYTALPDSGVVELHCGTHNPPVTWKVGYHPSLDVLIGQAAAHDRTEHDNDSAAGDHAAEIRKLRGAVRELLDSTGLDDGEKAEWLERAGIDLEDE